MNEKQRKELGKAVDILTALQEQEQEKYDNAPENLQSTERVEKFQENADALEEAIDVLSSLEE